MAVILYISGFNHVARIWPAKCVCAARDIIKTIQIIDKTTVLQYNGTFSLQL